VTKDSVFPIASCSKSFTAACVALLIDEGKLRWDDPVIKYLSDFELADPYLMEDFQPIRTGASPQRCGRRITQKLSKTKLGRMYRNRPNHHPEESEA
jgi:CubicO group peptidase (beta-lactamase class C family)